MQKIRSFVSRRRWAVITVLSIFIGLLGCVMIVGFIPFSNKALKTKVEQILGDALNGRCEVGGLKVTLWKGIIIDNVSYSSRDAFKDAPELSCKLPRVTASYYLLPLISRHLIINTVSLEKPFVEVNYPTSRVKAKQKRTRENSTAALKQSLSTLPYTVLIRKISVNGGRIEVKQGGRPMASGKGIDLSVRVSIHRGLSLEGRLTSPELTFPGAIRFVGCRASIKTKGTEVSLYDCRAGLYGGELMMNGGADLSLGTLNSFSASLNDLDLSEWYRVSGKGRGDLKGKLNAHAELEKSMLLVDSLKGRGWVNVASVSTRGTPLHRNLVVRLVVPKLEILKFNKIHSDLLLRKGRIMTTNFYGKGDPLDFTANGWFDTDGRLSQRVEGVFSADFSANLSPIVRNSLFPVEKDGGGRAFKCSVGGTVESPRLEIDQRIVKRAVGNVFDALGKLFRRQE